MLEEKQAAMEAEQIDEQIELKREVRDLMKNPGRDAGGRKPGDVH